MLECVCLTKSVVFIKTPIDFVQWLAKFILMVLKNNICFVLEYSLCFNEHMLSTEANSFVFGILCL